MKTIEELKEACDRYFDKIHSSWWAIKEVVEAVINQYCCQLEAKEYVVEISENTSEIFYGSPMECLACMQDALRKILDVRIGDITLSGETIKVTIPGTNEGGSLKNFSRSNSQD